MIAHTRVETIGRCLPPESGKFCTLFYTVDPNWRVSTDPEVAALINAAHVLLGYDLRTFRLTPENFARAGRESAP